MKEKSLYLKSINFLRKKIFEENISIDKMTVPVTETEGDDTIIGMCTLLSDLKCNLYEVRTTKDLDEIEFSFNGNPVVNIAVNEEDGISSLRIPYNEHVKQSTCFEVCSAILKVHKERLNDCVNY